MNTKMFCVMAFAVGSVATQAAAKPVYLDCTRTNGEKGKLRETFTLDESSDSGTHAIPKTGLSSGKLPADFGQKEVVLTERSETGMVSEYVFDRVTLKYTLLRPIGGKLFTHRGSCSLAKPPLRKF